jgi:serine phosphatase RsbU (regulator of sigma subunit)
VPVLAVLAAIAGVLLFAGALVAALPLLRAIRRRLLWRVSRKLTLSYIFVAVVPAILIVTFFLLCGLLLFFNVGGFIVRSRADSLLEQARSLAGAVAANPAAPLPAGGVRTIVSADQLPEWLPRGRNYAALVGMRGGEVTMLTARGLAWADSNRAAIVDLPFDPDATLQATTGAAPALQWVTFLEWTDWVTGESVTAPVPFRMSIAEVYRRVAGGPLARMGTFDFGQFLLALVGAVAALFLVIEIGALGMGLGLARTITGAIHDLFQGTERIREGDFTHRIPIRRRDQLGELADSFNSMTASVEDLLRQKAEKERLAQELKVARDIQMSLLPSGPVRMPGVTLAGYCEPAREVGGDYYDFLPIDDKRLGVLIADVSGKGTSAALYMAELKGLMLSLSRQHRSPRALLIDANQILSHHLDPRSFVTTTYAVIDLERQTLTHARAGHCPTLYRPAAANGHPRTRMLAPDGLVLGLQIDNGETFNRLLQEETVPLSAGDLFMLYTDGLTEATNAAGEWFGEGRLAALIEDHGALGFEDLEDRMRAELRSFAGGQPQHDDMTWVLIRIG